MLERSILAARLARWLPRTTFPPAGEPIRCGVSGGADSLAMLALAVANGNEVTAVHVDHAIRAGSGAEASRVAAFVNQVGAAFEEHVAPVDAGPNLEARMRAARYAMLGPDAATAHTADDQAETVLINLLRGAGVAGLGAMRPGSRRPLLALRRRDTEAICRVLDWRPVVDPTNADPAFLRNRIRAELVPLMNDLAERDVVPLLARTASHMRATAEALAPLVSDLDPSDARAITSAPRAVAALALQQWIREAVGAEHPVDSASIDRVLEVAAGSVVATEVVGGTRISRSGQRLRLGDRARAD